MQLGHIYNRNECRAQAIKTKHCSSSSSQYRRYIQVTLSSNPALHNISIGGGGGGGGVGA